MTHPNDKRIRSLRRPAVGLAVLASMLPLSSCSDDATGPSELQGGVWRLESMQLAGAARFTPDDPERFLVEFRADGRLGVVADCNQCGGTYSLRDGNLTVPALACTLIFCSRPEGGQFASLIDGTSSVERKDDELEIESADGSLVLRR